MKKLAYSLDGETYYEREHIEYELESYGESDIVYVGEQIKQKHSDFIGIDDLIEKMKENAHEVSPDFSDDYLGDMTKEHQNNIEKIILDYLDKNIEQPTFYLIENVKEITPEEFLKGNK
ncbi:MAG: hypothetical protein HRT41_02130 [Campylobacteraceae bacterium]|nr:hypothetical protein [Campylobacteraceae bacterium]